MKPSPLLLPIPARAGRHQQKPSWATLQAAACFAGAVVASAFALYAVKRIDSQRDIASPPLKNVWEALDAALEFRLTQHSYVQGSHIEACSSEFGPSYQIADWEHDLGGRSMSAQSEESAPSDMGRLTADQVRNLSDTLRIPRSFNSRLYFVNASSQGGRTAPAYYYFERHDGHPPGDFVASDQHGGLSLSLLSASHRHQNGTGQVLCVQRALVDAQPASEDLAHVAVWVASAIRREFRFTQEEYTAQSHSEACSSEFGSSYKTVDWSYDLKGLTAEQLNHFGDTMGFSASDDPRFFIVSDQGWKFPAYTKYTGAFFVARQEAIDQPNTWASLDPFALGISHRIRGPVLCVKATRGSTDAVSMPASTSQGGAEAMQGVWQNFRLTQHKYKVLEEFGDDMCSGEYGAGYEVADWTVDLGGLDANQVKNLTAALHIPESLNSRFYLVTVDGKARHGWDYYYFEHHDGRPPNGFKYVGRHGPLSLGHAEFIDGQALCVYRGNSGR